MGILKSIYRGVLRKLPEKPALYLIYFRGYCKLLNLKNPCYFGERIQWLKLYGHLEELTPFVDKYEVRNYVEKTVGRRYLNHIWGIYDSEDDIDFDTLPTRFVLKCTNGSQSLLICKDKSQLDIIQAKKAMHAWLDDEFYKMKKENQYKHVKNRIIVEEYLEDDSGGLRDYKVYCFDGEPFCYCVFANRFTDKTIDTFDLEGNWLRGVLNGGVKNSENPQPLSENIDELMEITRKLASPFRFVRVDYYIVNGSIYFGELTFTDGAGAEKFTPLEYDLEMGRRIPLANVLIK